MIASGNVQRTGNVLHLFAGKHKDLSAWIGEPPLPYGICIKLIDQGQRLYALPNSTPDRPLLDIPNLADLVLSSAAWRLHDRDIARLLTDKRARDR